MFASESKEYFTLQESDGSGCGCVHCTQDKRNRQGKSQQRKHYFIDSQVGNSFITPAHSRSNHKFRTPYSSRCHSRAPSPKPRHKILCTDDREPTKPVRSKNRRNRSLSIHISPARVNCPPSESPQNFFSSSRPVKCEGCRKAQVASAPPCHYKWGPVYQPPSNCPSNTTVVSSYAQCGNNNNQNLSVSSLGKNRTCPVYQPEQQSSTHILSNEDDLYPERVAQNLSEDRRRHDDVSSGFLHPYSQSEKKPIQSELSPSDKDEDGLTGYNCDETDEFLEDQNDRGGATNYQSLTRESQIGWTCPEQYSSPSSPPTMTMDSQRYDPIQDTEEESVTSSRREYGHAEAALYRQMVSESHKYLTSSRRLDDQTTGIECEEEDSNEEESTFLQSRSRVQFRPVKDLPKPTQIRRWMNDPQQQQQEKYRQGRKKPIINKTKARHHHRHRLKSQEQMMAPSTTVRSKTVTGHCPEDNGGNNIFPFRKTPSGNLKIYTNQVAFQSKQLAVLVNDPRRTRVQLKQERVCPPPIPPLYSDDPPTSPPPCDSSRRTKLDSWHRIQSPDSFTPCVRQKRSKSCYSRPPPCPPSCKREESKARNDFQSEISCLEFQTQNQCRNSADFIESLHYRMRRAIHPDTKIVIGTKEFPCHSLALQAYSKYFDCIKRPSEMIHRISLPEEIIKPEDFPNLMDWILLDEDSKCLVISSTNVVALYSAAQCLGIPGLQDHCLAFINEKLEACDPILLQLYEDARQKSTHCKDLMCSLSPKLAQLFPIVYKSRQFLSLSPDELIMLIDSDDVKIQSELDIYDAAARWLLYDWTNRSQYAVRVMKCVRFGLLTPLQLTQIRHCADCANLPDYSHIYSFQEIKDLLCDGLTYAIFKKNYKSRPGEFNKWVDWSKVNAPRPRNNVDGNPDVLRLPAKIPVDGYPSYDDFCESENRLKDRSPPSIPFTNRSRVAQGCDSNTAVRDDCCSGGLRQKSSRPHSPPPVLLMPAFVEQGQNQGDRIFGKDPCGLLFDPKKNDTLECTDGFERTSTEDTNPYDPQNTQQEDQGQSHDTWRRNQGTPRKLRDYLFESSPPPPLGKRYGKIHNRAATRIQAHYKGHLIRQQYLQMKNATITIQRSYRRHRYNKRRRQHQKLQQQYNQQSRGGITLNRMDRVKRLRIPGTEVVVIFGGMNPQDELSSLNNCQTVYRFNPEENVWSEMGQMPEPRSHCGIVYDQKSIILFGGSDPRNQTVQGRNIPSTSCWALDPLTGKWSSLPSMRVARTNFGYCKWHGKIYVFGGKDVTGKDLSSCEKFDPNLGSSGKWSLIPPMQVPCMSMAVSKFGDKIFVVGGVSVVAKGGGKRSILKTVLVFDPVTNSWGHQTALKYGRCYAQLASHYNQLFLVGGAGKVGTCDGTQSLLDVTVFDDGEWEQVGRLKKPRHGHSLVKIGKHLLVMGGVSSESMEPLDTVEIYNTETNRSSSRVSVMPQKLTGMAAVVL